MGLLASVPVWVMWVVLGIAFVVSHALSYRPPSGPDRGRPVKRLVSSALLLLALVVVEPSEPATVLLALAATVASGFLSGRAAPSLPSR